MHNITTIKATPKDWDPDSHLPAYLRDRRAELYNPMKDNRITFTEKRVIEKMKLMGKFDPLRDMNPPNAENAEWTLKKVDSLVESVYNSQKNLDWLKEMEAEGFKGKKPPPASVVSESDYNIHDSRDRL